MSDRPWWASNDGGDGGDAREQHTHRHRAEAPAEVCAVCPVCAFLRVVGDTRPEVLEHLTEAARHLTLAAKAVVDAQAEQFSGGAGRLERIDLDEE